MGKFGKRNLQEIMKYFPFKDKRFVAKKIINVVPISNSTIEFISFPRLELLVFEDFVKYVKYFRLTYLKHIFELSS